MSAATPQETDMIETEGAPARPAGTYRPAGGQGPADAHQPTDRQGHRTPSARALAIPGRARRGRSPRLPVHRRDRRRRASIRYPRPCRWARGVGGDLCRRARAARRADRQSLDGGDQRADPAGRRRGCDLPGGCDHRRSAQASRRGPVAPPRPRLDAGLRRGTLSYRDAVASRATPRAACRIWAPTAPR